MTMTILNIGKKLNKVHAQSEVESLLGPIVWLHVVRDVIIDLYTRQTEDTDRQSQANRASDFS